MSRLFNADWCADSPAQPNSLQPGPSAPGAQRCREPPSVPLTHRAAQPQEAARRRECAAWNVSEEPLQPFHLEKLPRKTGPTSNLGDKANHGKGPRLRATAPARSRGLHRLRERFSLKRRKSADTHSLHRQLVRTLARRGQPHRDTGMRRLDKQSLPTWKKQSSCLKKLNSEYMCGV